MLFCRCRKWQGKDDAECNYGKEIYSDEEKRGDKSDNNICDDDKEKWDGGCWGRVKQPWREELVGRILIMMIMSMNGKMADTRFA